MVVQHNMQAANTNRFLNIAAKQQASATEKLSSGYRINRAADDAAGLSISEKMRQQIRGLNKASKNAEDGISLIQTAEGAMNEMHSILQRMSELATQAANDTNVTVDRKAIQKEINQLSQELGRVGSTTQYNEMNLLDGTFSNKNLQVGANSGQRIQLDINGIDSDPMKVVTNKTTTVTTLDGLKVSSYDSANTAMNNIKDAIKDLSEQRSDLGAKQNRLDHTVKNLDNIAENLQDAESSIRDTDMADEMVTYSKNNIVAQAATSMLAQANQSTQGVLSLLQ